MRTAPTYSSGKVCRSGGRIALALFVFALLLPQFALVHTAAAQWQIKTPRDTVFVPANQPSWTQSYLQLNSKIAVSMNIHGTFGLWPGQNGAGFDARYTYNVPGWLAPYPLTDPPSFNGTSYQIFLAVDTNRLSESIIRVNENNYQSSHVYTARYVSSGLPMRFRIKDRVNERPDGYYYSTGTGGVTIELARFTAGVALKQDSVEFGTVLIGSAIDIPDSIESYGTDALQVDSIRIYGSNDFSFNSQFGDHFSLASERTNEIKLRYAPSSKFDAYADVMIFAHNADGVNQRRMIRLHGVGGAPSIAIGPHNLDFGKVRVSRLATLYTNVYNGGNADLFLTDNPINPIIPEFFTQPVITPTNKVTVNPTMNWQMRVHFQPSARKKYAATLFIQGQNVPLDSVHLTGEGVEPVPVLSTTALDFGSVRRGDNSKRTVTLTNQGNMTATILSVAIYGPSLSAFSVTPSDSTYLVDPDSSLVFHLTFEPGTGPEGQRHAWLELDYDDGSVQKVDLQGFELEPRLLFSRGLMDFGKVELFTQKSDTITLHNNSSVALPLPTTPYVAPLSGPFAIGYAPVSLPGSGSDSIQVVFKPLVRGPAAGWLHTFANGQFDSVFVTGIGALPLPALSLDTLDFGIHPSGIPATLFTVLSDTGDFDLRVVHTTITGPDAADFTFSSSAPTGIYALAPGHDTAIAVTFVTNAKTGQLHQALLTITYADSNKSHVVLLAREQSQYVQFAQKQIDFGKVRVKSIGQQIAVFSNGSNLPLRVGSLSITQTTGAFSLGDTSTLVRAQDTSNVPVYFQPQTRGSFSGYLHARAGDIRPDSVWLIGVGAGPVPIFSTRTVDCGLVPIAGSASKNLTLTNAGDWVLTAQIALKNDTYNEFSITTLSGSSTADTVASGGNSVYAIKFSPKVARLLHTADLLFTYDDQTVDTIHLLGEDEFGQLVIDSTSLSFGKVRVGTSAAQTMHLINTSPRTLSVTNVSLAPAGTPFVSNALGTLTVATHTQKDIAITFSPIARGQFSTTLIAAGGDINDDTVKIAGTGVAPLPQFAQSTLNFGTLFVGDPGVQSTSLTNAGDWDLQVTSVTAAGPNQSDFDWLSIPSSFTLKPSEMLPLTVNFTAKTPYQATPRTASLIFTLDDGTSFALQLTETDKAPDRTQIVFENYLARPGDFVFENLLLKTPIAPAANVQELSGSFSFDTTIVQLLQIDRGPLVNDPSWTLNLASSRAGAFESINYDLKSPTMQLTNTGSLLQMKFVVNPQAKVGGKTDLKQSNFQFYNTNQVMPLTVNGVIVVDSTCGDTHLESGQALTTFVQQNSPNPFGSITGQNSTSIPFDVGAKNTVITIRILDVSGREILRPIDHRSFGQGHYTVTLDGSSLTSGLYFYEFQAEGGKPQIKKLIFAQ